MFDLGGGHIPQGEMVIFIFNDRVAVLFINDLVVQNDDAPFEIEIIQISFRTDAAFIVGIVNPGGSVGKRNVCATKQYTQNFTAVPIRIRSAEGNVDVVA